MVANNRHEHHSRLQQEPGKKGTKYALVVGTKVYTLEGHEAELDKLAGARATVKGSVMGEMVMVESVAAAKKMAKWLVAVE